MKFLILIFSIVLLFNNTSAQPKYYTSLLIDSCSCLTVKDVINSNRFLAIEKPQVFNKSTEEIYWMKITPETKFSDTDRILFSNTYNHYESIYFLEDSIILNKYTIGLNEYNQSKTFIPSFELSESVTTILIRISSETFLFESISIKDEDEALKDISIFLLIQFLFLGVIVSITLYVIVLYIKSRKAIIGSYLLYLIAMILMFLFISNIGQYFIWGKLPFSASILEFTFVYFMVCTYLIFAMKITMIETLFSQLTKLTIGFLIVSGVSALIMGSLFHTRYFSLMANSISAVAVVFLIVYAFLAFRIKRSEAVLYLFGIISFIIGTSLRLGMNFGILPYSLTIDAFVLIGLLIEIIIFTLIVIRQIESNLKDVVSYEEVLKRQDAEILNLKTKLNSPQNRDKLETSMSPEEFREVLNQKLKTTITSREAEVLIALMEEGTLKEIAGKLFISLNTLKTHASRIYSKLDSRNRLEAIYKALEIIKDNESQNDEK